MWIILCCFRFCAWRHWGQLWYCVKHIRCKLCRRCKGVNELITHITMDNNMTQLYKNLLTLSMHWRTHLYTHIKSMCFFLLDEKQYNIKLPLFTCHWFYSLPTLMCTIWCFVLFLMHFWWIYYAYVIVQPINLIIELSQNVKY